MERIFEANFSPKDALKVAKLYGSLFGKEFGSPFRPLTVEWFKKTKESGQGVRMINKNGAMLRINYSNRMSNFAKTPSTFITLSSIDYWAPGNSELDNPTTTCYFTQAVNVVQIWKNLAMLIRTGKAGKYTIADLAGIKESEMDLDEAFNKASGKERLAFIDKKGWPSASKKSAQAFQDFVIMNNAEDEWNEFVAEIEAGKPESNQTSELVKSAEKEFNNHPTCDPKRIFEIIERLTFAVCKGVTRSFICCGMGGVGKTYHVTKVMTAEAKNNGVKYSYHSGFKVTPQKVFAYIFQDRDKIIIFDEADDILKNEDVVVMLKSPLDTAGKHTMEYMNGFMPVHGMSDDEVRAYSADCDNEINLGSPVVYSNKQPKDGVWLPAKFFFDGAMIFISNMPASKIDQAILSRSAFVDVWLTEQQVENRIWDILQAKCKNGDFSQEVLQKFADSMHLGEDVSSDAPPRPKRQKQLTVRTCVMAIELIEKGFDDWQELMNYF